MPKPGISPPRAVLVVDRRGCRRHHSSRARPGRWSQAGRTLGAVPALPDRLPGGTGRIVPAPAGAVAEVRRQESDAPAAVSVDTSEKPPAKETN